MSNHDLHWIRKFQLEDKPLLSLWLASCEIRLYSQKETNLLACMKLCQNKASVSLHNGVYGSKLIGTKRVIYGQSPPETVTAVATTNQRTNIDVQVASDAFLFVVASLEPIMVTFSNNAGVIVQELGIPAWPRHRKLRQLKQWFTHLLYDLGLLPVPKHNTPLRR